MTEIQLPKTLQPLHFFAWFSFCLGCIDSCVGFDEPEVPRLSQRGRSRRANFFHVVRKTGYERIKSGLEADKAQIGKRRRFGL